MRGGFVPPFVRKALDANNAKGAGREEAEGQLSAKTLEMLAGPDGELPEVGSLHWLTLLCRDLPNAQHGYTIQYTHAQASAFHGKPTLCCC